MGSTVKPSWVTVTGTACLESALSAFAFALEGEHPPEQFLVESLVSLKDVRIDDISAPVNLDVDILRELKIDGISGDIDITANMIDDLDINSVSASIEIAAEKVGKIGIDSVSGNVDATIESTLNLSSIKIDSISGDAKLYLDGTRGYRLVFDSISGKQEAEFTDGTDASIPRYDIKVETVSGDLKIYKNREYK